MSFIKDPNLKTTDEGIRAALSCNVDEVLDPSKLYRDLDVSAEFTEIMNALDTLKNAVFKHAWEFSPTRKDMDENLNVTDARNKLVSTVAKVHGIDEREAQEAVDNYYRALVNYINGVCNKGIDPYLGGLECAASQAQSAARN